VGDKLSYFNAQLEGNAKEFSSNIGMTPQPASPATGGGVEAISSDGMIRLLAHALKVDASEIRFALQSAGLSLALRNEGAADPTGAKNAQVADRVLAPRGALQAIFWSPGVLPAWAFDQLKQALAAAPAAEGDRVLVPREVVEAARRLVAQADVSDGKATIDLHELDALNSALGDAYLRGIAAAPASPADGGGGVDKGRVVEILRTHLEIADVTGPRSAPTMFEIVGYSDAADALLAALSSRPAVREKLVGALGTLDGHGYDRPEHLAQDLRQIAENRDRETGYATADAKIIRTAAALFDGLPIDATAEDNRVKARAALKAHGGVGNE
jgi:hypothetical protein